MVKHSHTQVIIHTLWTSHFTFIVIQVWLFQHVPSLNRLLRIKLRPLAELVSGANPENATANLKKISLDTEFVFLTDNERNYMMSRPLDYVITQVQMSKFVMKAGENTKSVMLNFSHPVRELFFVSQSEAAVTANHPNRYNTLSNVKLQFNNEVVFNRGRKFLVYEQSLKHHISPPEYVAGTNYKQSEFGMYSFALKPEVYYPTGQVNMSRIFHKLLTIQIDPINDSDNNNTRVYAVNYNILRVDSGLAGLKF